jgi:hypothetical protein
MRKCRFLKQIFAAPLLILLSATLQAQQPTQAARQMVPDNPAPHLAPEQPVPYSHKTHVAIGLQCQLCHTNPEPGNQMTFPQTSTCMKCHVSIAKTKPSIVKLTALSKSNQAIPWVRVYQVTPGVTWNHRKHLQANLQCVMCHGNVAQLDAMAQTTAVTAMGSCIGCHQTFKAKTTCETCHAWPSDSDLRTAAVQLDMRHILASLSPAVHKSQEN